MMKDAYFIYSVGILAIVGFLVCFIGYATNTLPMYTPKHTSAIIISPTSKKNNCTCCAIETANIVKAIRQSRKKISTYQKRYTQVTDIITQYGLEEGLRKLKQSDPEIAAQFEHFFLKHPTDSKNAQSSP